MPEIHWGSRRLWARCAGTRNVGSRRHYRLSEREPMCRGSDGLGVSEYGVDESVVACFLCREPLVAHGVSVHLADRLAGAVGGDLQHALSHAVEPGRLHLDVGGAAAD